MIYTDKEGYFEEYKFITAEIVKRAELGFTILNITFVAAAAFWSTALSSKPFIFAVYPAVAALLTLGYGANAVVMSSLGHYMREVLEEEIYEFCWASYFDTILDTSLTIGKFLTFGIFVGSSVISLFLYFKLAGLTVSGEFSSIDGWVLFGLICTVFSGGVLYKVFNHKPENIYDKVKGIRQDKENRNVVTSP